MPTRPLVLITEAPFDWVISQEHLIDGALKISSKSLSKALQDCMQSEEWLTYSHIQCVSALQYDHEVMILLQEAQQRAPQVLLIGYRHTAFRGWAWVYHVVARFWWAILGDCPLKDPTSPYRSYPRTFLEKTISWHERGLAREQKLLLEAEEQNISIEEVHLGKSDRAHTVVVSVRVIWSLVVLYATHLVRRVKKEFTYPMLKGEPFYVQVHHMVRHEIQAHINPHKAALAVAVGVFWGMTPFHGFHVILGFMSALLAKLNRPLTFLGLNITCPPLLLFWIPFSTKVGEWVLPGQLGKMWHEAIAQGGYQALLSVGFEGLKFYVVGSLVLAPILALLLYPITYIIFSVLEKRPKFRHQEKG